MDSNELARFIEQSNGISKPWLLMQLRLKKLEEERSTLTKEDYTARLVDMHDDLMRMGRWWEGIEDQVF
ncbi:MAG: hypothetical protein H7Y37_16340 [Anaerolineae bacterium]|nr:hypothetical protein [Gloeobacterales cyanobacterium ES-bin-313]